MSTTQTHFTKFFVAIFFSGILVSTVLNVLIFKLFLQKEKNASTPISSRVVSKYAYTNPLIECELYPRINKNLTPFEDRLNIYISDAISNGKTKQVSMYYRDLINGPWIGINEEEQFSPASLLKVPLMMSVLRVADQDPTFLEKQIVFEPSNNNTRAQSVLTGQPLVMNEQYSVNQLMEYMIINSDNDAATILSRNIPQTEFYKVYQELALPVPKFENSEYYIDVVKYASFFRILYNSTYLDADQSERALSILATSAYKDGLVAGVPENVRVAHKFGERQWQDQKEQQLHDCGIVYHPVRPYLLCVMTKGEDPARLSTVIKEISKITYEEVNSQVQ